MNGKNNITIGFLTMGLLMPLGILGEWGCVLLGAVAMTASTVWLGFAFFNMKTNPIL